MALKYADFCTCCGKRRTKHPSKMCAVCRRKEDALAAKADKHRTICKQCGRRMANSEVGICSVCKQGNERGNTDYEQRLRKAIQRQKDVQFVLERRLEGNSFNVIAEMTGIPVSHVYRNYADAMGFRANKAFRDYVDNAVIQPEERREDM